MTLIEAVYLLQNYNAWRRGAEIPQPNATKIGIALEIVINHLTKEINE